MILEAGDRLDWLDCLFRGTILAVGVSVLLWSIRRRVLLVIKGKEGDRDGGQAERNGV